MWFTACLLYKCNIPEEPEAEALWEESIVLIRAANEDEARTKAEDVGKRGEHEYLAAAGNQCRWTFEKIANIQEIMTQQLEHGTQIYSRFLHLADVQSLMARFAD